MRLTTLGALAALAGLLAAGLASVPAVEAATPVGCAGPAAIVGYTGAGRGIRIDVLRRFADPAVVEAMLRERGWDKAIGRADAVVLYYAHPSRYLLFAAARGCHVAHAFLEEAEARALMAE